MSVLVLACGNTCRSDDGLGPTLIGRLQVRRYCQPGWPRDLRLVSVVQWQVEHAADLLGCQAVLFVDAAVRGPSPYAVRAVSPEPTISYSTHALSASAVLAAFEQAYQKTAPPAWLLAIRGYCFEPEDGLTRLATQHLDAAETWTDRWLKAAGGGPLPFALDT